MSDIYRTITASSEASVTEKRSRFLAFAYPVTTVDEVKVRLTELQKKHFDARHICWAYMLGPKRTEFRSNDNGEPSGTAGKPILGQINSLGVTDVAVVVVRYFGGIKLGTPGLTAAYREAARLAITDAGIVEKQEMSRLSITFPYMSVNEVMKTAKLPGLKIVEQAFDNSCSMTIEMPLDMMEEIAGRLGSVDGVSIAG